MNLVLFSGAVLRHVDSFASFISSFALRQTCRVMSETISTRDPVPLFEAFLEKIVPNPRHFIECLQEYKHVIVGSAVLQVCLGETFAGSDLDIVAMSNKNEISASEHSNHTPFIHKAFYFPKDIVFYDEIKGEYKDGDYRDSQLDLLLNRLDKSNCYEFLPAVITKYQHKRLQSRFDYIVVRRENCRSVLDYVDRHNDFKFTCALFDGKKLKIKFPDSIATKSGGTCDISTIPVYRGSKVILPSETRDSDHHIDAWKSILARKHKYKVRGFQIEVTGNTSCFYHQVVSRIGCRGVIPRRLSNPHGPKKYKVIDSLGKACMEDDLILPHLKQIINEKRRKREFKNIGTRFHPGLGIKPLLISRRKSTTSLPSEVWNRSLFRQPTQNKNVLLQLEHEDLKNRRLASIL